MRACVCACVPDGPAERKRSRNAAMDRPLARPPIFDFDFTDTELIAGERRGKMKCRRTCGRRNALWGEIIGSDKTTARTMAAQC